MDAPKAKRTRLSKTQMLQRAAEVLREKGFAHTSMDAIARALEMPKSHLYYHFTNKNLIAYLCHDRSLSLLIKVMLEIERSREPAEVRLKRLLTEYMRLVITEPTARLAASRFELLSGEFHQRICQKRHLFELGLRQILADGIDEGVFHPFNPKILGFVILGALNWIASWYSPEGEMSPEALIDTISEVLMGAVMERAPRRVRALGTWARDGIVLPHCRPPSDSMNHEGT